MNVHSVSVDLEWGEWGHGIFQGTIPAFAWKT